MPVLIEDVRRALHELGDLRYEPHSLDQAFQRIVDTTHNLFNVDGAGLMLADTSQTLRNVTVSDTRVHDLEELQIEHDEGPCIDAYDERHLVEAEDLTVEQRWPSFSPVAVERGLRAVLASPIPYNRSPIGVVSVFSSKRHPWSPEGELALAAMTDLASMLITNTLQGEERGELVEQLQTALESRVAVEQAKGVLVARYRISPKAAFERLRRQARDERLPLAEVAARIVARAHVGAPTRGPGPANREDPKG